jgi:hypothetical protein
MPGDDRDASARSAQSLGQDADHGGVCSAVDRRRGDAHEQASVADAGDGGARSPRHHAHADADTAGDRPDVEDAGRHAR